MNKRKEETIREAYENGEDDHAIWIGEEFQYEW